MSRIFVIIVALWGAESFALALESFASGNYWLIDQVSDAERPPHYFNFLQILPNSGFKRRDTTATCGFLGCSNVENASGTYQLVTEGSKNFLVFLDRRGAELDRDEYRIDGKKILLKPADRETFLSYGPELAVAASIAAAEQPVRISVGMSSSGDEVTPTFAFLELDGCLNGAKFKATLNGQRLILKDPGSRTATECFGPRWVASSPGEVETGTFVISDDSRRVTMELARPFDKKSVGLDATTAVPGSLHAAHWEPSSDNIVGQLNVGFRRTNAPDFDWAIKVETQDEDGGFRFTVPIDAQVGEGDFLFAIGVAPKVTSCTITDLAGKSAGTVTCNAQPSLWKAFTPGRIAP